MVNITFGTEKTECYTNQSNSAITDVGIGHYVRFYTRGNDKMGVTCVWWEKGEWKAKNNHA